MSQEEELHVIEPGDHGQGHDHDHDHDDDDHEHHDDTPLADLPATPVHGYWRSMRELSGQASFQIARTGSEFPPEAEQAPKDPLRSEEHTSELQSPCNLVCRLLLET